MMKRELILTGKKCVRSNVKIFLFSPIYAFQNTPVERRTDVCIDALRVCVLFFIDCFDCLGRRNGSSRRSYVLLLMSFSFLSFFFSTRDLRAPSPDRREILPRNRKWAIFYNL